MRPRAAIRPRLVALAVALVLLAAGAVAGLRYAKHRGIGRQPAAVGCGDPLDAISGEVRTGTGSLVVATGTLLAARREQNGLGYRQLHLSGVTVLRGAPLPTDVDGWLEIGPPPSSATAPADTPGLWAADGRLLALVLAGRPWPGQRQLSVAPVVGTDVIMSSAGCWTSDRVPGRATPYTGTLQEVPGSYAERLAARYGGFHPAAISQLLAAVDTG